MAQVTLFTGPMAKLLHAPTGPVGQHINKSTLAVHGEARRLCPVDEGRLRSSISWHVMAGPIGVVGSNVNYAEAVHQGTRAHEIRPRIKKMLAWKPRGSSTFIFAKTVNHPGTRGQPFLTDALKILRRM